MARGESPKERPLSIGLAIVAIVAVASLCTVYSVVSSMRPPPAPPTYVMPGTAEPFVGATMTFGTLRSRDSLRTTGSTVTAPTRDPASARATLEGGLRDRGYVPGTTAETAPMALPLDTTPPDLVGACGVVEIVGDAGTTITHAGIAGGTAYRSIDPSAFTVALCDAQPVHVEGTGHVTMRTWLMPGLLATAATDTGLSPEALLSQAEAEIVLRRAGYVPVDELVAVTPSTTVAGGVVTFALPTTPVAGCTPFVCFAEGAGRPSIPPGQFDGLDDRGLVGAVACATSTRSWEPIFVDDSTVGARIVCRAYAASPAGAARATTPSIGGAHSVDAAHATWPTAIAEGP